MQIRHSLRTLSLMAMTGSTFYMGGCAATPDLVHAAAISPKVCPGLQLKPGELALPAYSSANPNDLMICLPGRPNDPSKPVGEPCQKNDAGASDYCGKEQSGPDKGKNLRTLKSWTLTIDEQQGSTCRTICLDTGTGIYSCKQFCW